jgi:hypothetical protein
MSQLISTEISMAFSQETSPKRIGFGAFAGSMLGVYLELLPPTVNGNIVVKFFSALSS